MPACPLGQLYAGLPCRDVRLGVRVNGLQFAGDSITGVRLLDGQVVPADFAMLATNHHTIRKWIPEELALRDERLAGLDRLQSVPILGAHLWFDRPVLRESHAALMSGPLQWLFRKDESGRVVHGVISAARAWIGRDKDDCLRQFEEQVRATLPLARSAQASARSHRHRKAGYILPSSRGRPRPTVPGADEKWH